MRSWNEKPADGVSYESWRMIYIQCILYTLSASRTHCSDFGARLPHLLSRKSYKILFQQFCATDLNYYRNP